MNMRRLIIVLCIITAQLAVAENRYDEPQKEPHRLRVGLVLGGGGAKGAVTVGVLKAIEKSGIPIDYIAGTSIGAIVGGMWACGVRSEQLTELFQNQVWSSLLTDRNETYKNEIWAEEDGVTYIFGFPIAGKGKQKGENRRKTIGLVHGDNILQLLDSVSGYRDSMAFDQLPIPFRCVAVDILSLREVVLDHGHLATAMRASMAIPGLFKPVELDSMLLIDGGVSNNLPVDVVRAMGADVVIAVDLTQKKHKEPDDVDIYINPQLDGCDMLSFQADKINKMIVIGEQTGKKYRKALRRLKKRIMKGE